MEKTPEQKKKLADIQQRIRAKAGAVAEFINSPIGRNVLEALEEEFYTGEMRGETPYDTYFRLGQRDVVDYLKQLQRIHERDQIDAT